LHASGVRLDAYVDDTTTSSVKTQTNHSRKMSKLQGAVYEGVNELKMFRAG
jgi:hypothetical protein